jgi:hypothetical protein
VDQTETRLGPGAVMLGGMTTDEKTNLTERQQWEELVTLLKAQLTVLHWSEEQVGKALYMMKLHLRENGIPTQGRHGRWITTLRRKDVAIDETSASRYIAKYQIAEDIPLQDCFYPRKMATLKKRMAEKIAKAKKPIKTGKINTGDLTVLTATEREKTPTIQAAPEESKDGSPEGRNFLNCRFVLTQAEREAFMEAVSKLGFPRATQVIHQSVVEAAKNEGGES